MSPAEWACACVLHTEASNNTPNQPYQLPSPNSIRFHPCAFYVFIDIKIRLLLLCQGKSSLIYGMCTRISFPLFLGSLTISFSFVPSDMIRTCMIYRSWLTSAYKKGRRTPCKMIFLENSLKLRRIRAFIKGCTHKKRHYLQSLAIISWIYVVLFIWFFHWLYVYTFQSKFFQIITINCISKQVIKCEHGFPLQGQSSAWTQLRSVR